MTWSEQAAAAIARYEGGESRDLDQRQLTQLANAAWAAGLCLLMDGRRDESSVWLRRAAERYRESWGGAPADSWGRPIAAMKALLLAGDDASDAARWALDLGGAGAESPIGRYAATLALIVLHRDAEARVLAETLVGRDDFPRDVADALWMIAGLRRSSSRTAFTAMSSARVRQNCPFGPALPNGVRTPSTKKTSRASRMTGQSITRS